MNEVIGEKGYDFDKTHAVFIDDYVEYNRLNIMVKRYQELKKKKFAWEMIKQELESRKKYEIHISDYLLGNYVSKKLIEEEEDELYSCES